MGISREEVEKVSLLGRLLLTDHELETMTTQMGQILGYMELLAEVDTEHVEPMAHAVELCDVFRADQACPSLPRDQALANAPEHDQECYRVPAVLGDS